MRGLRCSFSLFLFMSPEACLTLTLTVTEGTGTLCGPSIPQRLERKLFQCISQGQKHQEWFGRSEVMAETRSFSFRRVTWCDGLQVIHTGKMCNNGKFQWANLSHIEWRTFFHTNTKCVRPSLLETRCMDSHGAVHQWKCRGCHELLIAGSWASPSGITPHVSCALSLRIAVDFSHT